MTALLVVLLVVIAVLAASQAARRARASKRAVEHHHRALDTLGHITGHQAEAGQAGAAPTPAAAARTAPHSAPTDPHLHPHVRVVGAGGWQGPAGTGVPEPVPGAGEVTVTGLPARRLAGSPRAPGAEVEPPPAVAPVLDRSRAAARRPGLRWQTRRRSPRRPPGRPGQRRPGRAAVVIAALLVTGAAAALVVTTSGGSRPRATPPPAYRARPPAAAAPATVPPPSEVRLLSTSSGQATYWVAGPPATTLVASGRCWVEARSGGATGSIVFQGVLSSGQRQVLSGPLWLRLGNPGAVSVQVNGTVLQPPGLAAGQPYDLVVS